MPTTTKAGYHGPAAALHCQTLLERVEQIPGVSCARFARTTPLAGGGISQPVAVEQQPVIQQEIHFNAISRRYFETLGTQVVAGREFARQDRGGAPPVAIVNEVFARKFLAGGIPLGRRLRVGRSEQEFQVVGIVRDAIYESLWSAAPPTVYVPVSQWTFSGWLGVVFEVHAAGSLSQVAGNLRTTLQLLLPGAPVEVRALTDQVERALVRERLMATLASAFGLLGLVLAVIGLYGLLAYTVARRTHEIGIRLALGALKTRVLWLVVRNAFALLATRTCARHSRRLGRLPVSSPLCSSDCPPPIPAPSWQTPPDSPPLPCWPPSSPPFAPPASDPMVALRYEWLVDNGGMIEDLPQVDPPFWRRYGREGPFLRSGRRRHLRLPRPQRRGQVHYRQDALRPARSQLRRSRSVRPQRRLQLARTPAAHRRPPRRSRPEQTSPWEEHLLLTGAVYGISKGATETRANQLLHALSLEHGRNTFAAACSHGMRKKTSFAMALLPNPQILFLDEPFEAIDPVTSKIMRDLLLTCARRGVTVFLTSHILSVVEHIATQIVMIRKGSIVWDSPADKLPQSLEQHYFDLVESPAVEDLEWLGSSRS